MVEAPRPFRGHSPIHPRKRRQAKDKDLARLLNALESVYGLPPGPPLHDPFEWILWENVAYLASDERRATVFAALEQEIGTRPQDILAASKEAIHEIAKLGGMRPMDRAAKLIQIAEIAARDFQNDLNAALRLPASEARKALKRFPGIGKPGAEKILLFTRGEPVLALESNGVRVLARLGFGEEKKSYDATYRAVQQAASAALPKTRRALVRAHLLLRKHGQETCKTNVPRCEACAVAPACDYYARHRVT